MGWRQSERSEMEAKRRSGWEEREQRSEGERKIWSQLIWRMRERGKEGRRMDRGGNVRWRDMAHLLLFSGFWEIAGFPRSASCGSEFFPPLVSSHCLSFSTSHSHFLPIPHHILPLTDQWIQFQFLFQSYCDVTLCSCIPCLYVTIFLYLQHIIHKSPFS